MLKNVQTVAKIGTCIAAFAAAYFISDLATWGFTFTRLQTSKNIGFTNQGIPPLSELNQKYFLKAQGGQSYVFFSEDGKYVLKFFKDMPRPLVLWPSYQQKKLSKLKRTLGGYNLAFTRLPAETGLVYLHLQPSTAPLATPLVTTLVDRLNIHHNVDLSSVYFVLQKKAEPLTSCPDLAQVFELLSKRSAAHIADHDPRLYTNLGWIDGKLVFTDPGRFVEDPTAYAEIPEKFLEHFR